MRNPSNRNVFPWHDVGCLGSLLCSLTGDSNANVLDNAMDVAVQFAELSHDGSVDQFASSLLANAIEKGFSARPSTQTKSKALVLKLMEVNNISACTSTLLSKLSDKKPKIPPICLDLLTDGIAMFGITNFQVKDILKDLTSVLNGSNSSARDSALRLMVEIHRWVGAAPLQAVLEGMRTAQKTEFEKLVQEKGASDSLPPVPSVYTRRAREQGHAIVGAEANKSVAVDPRSYCEAIDLSKRLKSTDFYELIKSEKWSDHQQALSQLLKLMGPTPNLIYSPAVNEIIGICHGFLKQGHIQVQCLSLRIIGIITESLEQKVVQDLKPLLSTIIQRSKEKKLLVDLLNVAKAISKIGNPFDMFLQDSIEILKGKNPPHSKIWILELFEFILHLPKLNGASEHAASLLQAFLHCSEDSDGKVRETSIRALRSLISLSKEDKRGLGITSALRNLETSNPKLFAKIISAESKSSEVSDSNAADCEVVIPLVVHTKTESKISHAPSASNTSSNNPVSSGTATLPKKPAASAASKKPANAIVTEDDVVGDEGLMIGEQAVEILQTLLKDDWGAFSSKWGSAKWQDKVEGLSDLQKLLCDLKFADGRILCAGVVYLGKETGGFKSSNMMVTKGLIDLFASMVATSAMDKYAKSAAWELLQNIVEKISDKKVGSSVESLLSALCDLCGGSMITKRCCTLVEGSKAPAVHQTFLAWMKRRIDALGLAQVPVSTICPFCLKEIENKTAVVRTNAVEVLGAMYSLCGPKLLSILKVDQLAPQVKQLIDNEFNRVGFDEAAALSNDLPSDIFPRKDILTVVDKNIFKELNFTEGKNSWQNRKAALESVVSACESTGHNLEFTKQTAELVKALKLRLNDTQSNLKPLAMNAIGHLVASLPTDAAQRILKSISGSMLSGLAENKKSMRDSTIASLQFAISKGRDAIDGDLFLAIMAAVPEALTCVLGRQELLEWMYQHRNAFTTDQSELVQSLLLVLLDKLGPVRLLAEQLLAHFIAQSLVSKHSIEKATRDFAPANKRAIQPMLDRLQSTVIAAFDKPLSARRDEAPVHLPAPAPPTHLAHDHQNVDVAADCDANVPSRCDNQGRGVVEETSQDSALAAISWPQPPQEPGYNDLMYLKSCWSRYLDLDAADMLFPKVNRFDLFNQDALLPALEVIRALLNTNQKLLHLRYAFAWISYAIYVKETASMNKILEFVADIIASPGVRQHAVEAGDALGYIIPHVLAGVGSKSDKYGVALHSLFDALMGVTSPIQTLQFFESGLFYSSMKTRQFCVERIAKVIFAEARSPDLPSLVAGVILRVRNDPHILRFVVDAIVRSSRESGIECSSWLVSLDPSMQSTVAKIIAAVDTLDAKPNQFRSIGSAPSAEWTSFDRIEQGVEAYLIPRSQDSARIVAIQLLQILASAPKIQDVSMKMVSLLCNCITKSCSETDSTVDIPMMTAAMYALLRISKQPLFNLNMNHLRDLIESAIVAAERISQQSDWQLLGMESQLCVLRGLHSLIVNFTANFNWIQQLQALFEVACAGKIRSPYGCQAICRVADRLSTRSDTVQVDSTAAVDALLVSLSADVTNSLTSTAALHVMRKSIAYLTNEFGKDFVEGRLKELDVSHGSPVRVVFDRFADMKDSDSVHSRIVRLINQITSSTNKTEPIHELFHIRERHKDTINMDSYLSKLSPPFRSFVLETWQEMEVATNAVADVRQSDGPQSQQQKRLEVGTEGATEAMRILEGLKSRPNNFSRISKTSSLGSNEGPPDSPQTSSNRSAASPFARRNEKIRDSLCNLSASLDLPTTLRGMRIYECMLLDELK